jgi:hypothetical protein
MPSTVGELVSDLTAMMGRGDGVRKLGFQSHLAVRHTAKFVRFVNASFLSTGAKHGLEDLIVITYRDGDAVTQSELEFTIPSQKAP